VQTRQYPAAAMADSRSRRWKSQGTHEPDVLRRGRERAFQDPSFGCLRIRMVDLEDGNPAQARQAVHPGVEPRAENDELLRRNVHRSVIE
jgi:hypothetical protein